MYPKIIVKHSGTLATDRYEIMYEPKGNDFPSLLNEYSEIAFKEDLVSKITSSMYPYIVITKGMITAAAMTNLEYLVSEN